METEKRKTKTSTAVKRRYNEKTYGTVTAFIPKDLAGAFKEKCKSEGVSQAQIIKKAIEDFLGNCETNKTV